MSYQVLARKWRPRSFSELMGQEHVVRALAGGLEQGRLHHAFLFTGTRGVGKTTIARIIAKALNCETGVTATPCGVCSNCRDIDIGRFPDLLEIDAASRTKVDDTREILDNVLYAPARGRFKVYLIDEVHMLSTSSFNALLKTLEEPPEHVKFLLATTDPQKLPITVLSRCLKFHLKRLTVAQISTQMKHILQAETIEFEDDAIQELARGADGSMRDGLSLLDQALAFGGGRVETAATLDMLGSLSRHAVLDLLDAVCQRSPELLAERLQSLADFSGSYVQVLARVMESLHAVAFIQTLGANALPGDEHNPKLLALAEHMGPEDVQLKYQFALHGAKEVAIAPDAKIAFEMVMLRMMAFAEIDRSDGEPSSGSGSNSSGASSSRPSSSAAGGVRAESAVARAVEPVNDASVPVAPAETIVPARSNPFAAAVAALNGSSSEAVASYKGSSSEAVAPYKGEHLPSIKAANEELAADLPNVAATLATPEAAKAAPVQPEAHINPDFDDEFPYHADSDAAELADLLEARLDAEFQPAFEPYFEEKPAPVASNALLQSLLELPFEQRWLRLSQGVKLAPGPTRELVENALLRSWQKQDFQLLIQLTVDESHQALASAERVREIEDALQTLLRSNVVLSVRVEDADLAQSPASIAARAQAHAAQNFAATLEQHPLVHALMQNFDATVVPGSIQYTGKARTH
jgi:DNA polymerase III subunit gamma/tau